MRDSKRSLIALLVLTLSILTLHSALVIYIDPFFHFHAPLKEYYYKRPETVERYINDGIVRHFDYDALITGVSISSGFSITEFDKLFGVNAQKVIYSGGTFKEQGEGIERALKTNPDTRVILCSLFLTKLYQDKDHRRSDISDYPTYLYNDLFVDDIQYLFNKQVVFDYCYPMIKARFENVEGGVESFDTEGYIGVDENEIARFDDETCVASTPKIGRVIEQTPISDEEAQNVCENVEQNVIRCAEKNPNTRFIYFIPPCSIQFYKELYENRELLKTLQAEEQAIRMMAAYDNIELYSFNEGAVIEDRYNYSDSVHYGGWIYSYILENISQGRGKINTDNIDSYINHEYEYLLGYPY